MINLFRKTIVRISFEALQLRLMAELDREGFIVSGISDFQKEMQDRLNGHFRQYKILFVHVPYLSQQMLSCSPSEGVVLPCSITLLELQPGEVEIIPVNSTALIAREMHDASLQNLAEEVSRRLDRTIHSTEQAYGMMPDLFAVHGS